MISIMMHKVIGILEKQLKIKDEQILSRARQIEVPARALDK